MAQPFHLLVPVSLIAAFLVGLSKGGLPSVGTLAVPLLALVMPPLTGAALLLPIFVVSDMVGLYLYRREYSLPNLMILTPAALGGVVVGWIFSAQLSSAFLGMVVGIIGILFCLNAWFGARYRQTVRQASSGAGVFWGGMAGLTSFVSHSGGPAFQMYVLPQRLPKMTFAGTSTILFAVVNAAKIFPYWELGRFPPFDRWLFLMLAPAALIGTVVGKKMTQVMPDKFFFRTIEVSLLVLSLKLVFDYVASLIA
ncbi:sulfite exporter TauE/SafE family protein (plasmid) [Agrobacterium leguminum]|uniref:Probable membrane transporter protein n=1 Tax=Agrobacterium deltaense NCPPB 1641 TaxID=1183425 RepID=A0A1S7UAZ5_9HYPH|nr:MULTISPECIES: sulfite exporter TauE/SafE family protein [Agrobacterium]WFS69756.1 sulfite exporter TauE/SafE family protein [Agrobacterium leguminum]CVI64067.1 conserved membrane hypothetical protein [Agrobacterium deltaense NCPPB 1641]